MSTAKCIDDVAQLFPVSRGTVESWCRSGKINAVKAPNGHSWIIPADEYDRLEKLAKSGGIDDE